MQDVRLISLTPLAGSRGRVATTLARAIGDNDLLVMLSGPEGSGKSAILAAVVATLAYGGMRVIRVSNPDDTTMGQRELAARILGRPTMGSPAQLVAEAITNLLATNDDGQVVLVVDDAHTLSDQAMELLLVITSPARRGGRAPQLLLAGRGTFWERPWREELRVLTDVAEKYILEPLTTDDARDIVLDEAKAAGGSLLDVTPGALTTLVRCSSGLCGEMDRIVNAAVALGNSRQAKVLTEEIVDAVVTPDTVMESLSGDAAARDAGGAGATSTSSSSLGFGWNPRLGWPAIAGAVLVVGGLSVALVPTVRSALFGAGPTPKPAPSSEAVTAPPQAVPAQPPNETAPAPAKPSAPSTGDAATSPAGPAPPAPLATPAPAKPSAPSTGDAASSAAGTAPKPPVATPAPTPQADVVNKSPPPEAADAASVSAAHPVAPSDRTEPAPTKEQPPAPKSGPSAPATDATEAAPTKASPPPTLTAPAPAPSAVATPRPPQPATTPPIAPLPTAPPQAAALPAIPPPAATPTIMPPAAPPPAATPKAAAVSPPPAVTPPAVQPPPPAAPPHQNTITLPPAVIADLLARGKDELASGDVLSARLYFERAGAAGSEEGEMGAARTYDPGYLATIDAPGLQANAKRAIEWYRIAAETHGNAQAQKRIDELTAAGAD